MTERYTSQKRHLLLTHSALLVDAGVQVFVTASESDFSADYRKFRDEDLSVYVFPPGKCYFIGVKDRLVIEVPEEAFDHLASTGTIFVCINEPGRYMLKHALSLQFSKEKLLEAKGAYTAHGSMLAKG